MVTALLKKYIKFAEYVLIGLIAIVVVLIVHDNFVKPSLSTTNLKNNPVKLSGNTKNKYTTSSRINPKSHYKPILENNIFGLNNVTASIGAFNTNGSNVPGEAPETKLNIELIATIIDPINSQAVLKNLDNEKTNGYIVGEEVDIYKSEKIKISRVESCKVILERRNGFETIKCKTANLASLTKSRPSQPDRPTRTEKRDDDNNSELDKGIKEIGDNQFEVDQDLLDELLDDVNSIMSDIRVIPNEEGLKLFGMRRNTFFYKIGLRNGDTLNMINDVPLTDVTNALGIFEELKGQPDFTINLTRRKQKMTFEYEVK